MPFLSVDLFRFVHNTIKMYLTIEWRGWVINMYISEYKYNINDLKEGLAHLELTRVAVGLSKRIQRL
jgi:hypothetical protein